MTDPRGSRSKTCLTSNFNSTVCQSLSCTPPLHLITTLLSLGPVDDNVAKQIARTFRCPYHLLPSANAARTDHFLNQCPAIQSQFDEQKCRQTVEPRLSLAFFVSLLPSCFVRVFCSHQSVSRRVCPTIAYNAAVQVPHFDLERNLEKSSL